MEERSRFTLTCVLSCCDDLAKTHVEGHPSQRQLSRDLKIHPSTTATSLYYQKNIRAMGTGRTTFDHVGGRQEFKPEEIWVWPFGKETQDY
jgi:hypothetical protein